MLIASAHELRIFYPDATDKAIEYVRYVLLRALPHIEVHRPDLALASITQDVLAWDEPASELARFGLPKLVNTLPFGRRDVALMLDDCNLLHRPAFTG